jgi:uncharacterized protein YsxB (DUF464 family)
VIQVKVTRDEQQHIRELLLTGHADSGPYGQDLVCAAVSAVTIGTLNAIQHLLAVKIRIEADEERGGFLHCHFPAPSEQERELEEKIQLLLESMLFTLTSIADQTEYEPYITISDSGR